MYQHCGRPALWGPGRRRAVHGPCLDLLPGWPAAQQVCSAMGSATVMASAQAGQSWQRAQSNVERSAACKAPTNPLAVTDLDIKLTAAELPAHKHSHASVMQECMASWAVFGLSVGEPVLGQQSLTGHCPVGAVRWLWRRQMGWRRGWRWPPRPGGGSAPGPGAGRATRVGAPAPAPSARPHPSAAGMPAALCLHPARWGTQAIKSSLFSYTVSQQTFMHFRTKCCPSADISPKLSSGMLPQSYQDIMKQTHIPTCMHAPQDKTHQCSRAKPVSVPINAGQSGDLA